MQSIDLTNCEREPIHIPGAIQPHGVLLVIDPVSEKILQVAGDTDSLLGPGRSPPSKPRPLPRSEHRVVRQRL